MKIIIETNELNKDAMGGTEMMQHALISKVDKELLDQFQIIASRVRELDPDKKKVLWLHDLANDPEAAHLSDATARERFDGFVCVSNWQMQMYNMVLGLPYHKSIVLKNAIDPIEIKGPKVVEDKINIIYHTTPHRGLEILIPVFEFLQQRYPVHLDVYSSFSIYGWPERDKQYEELFDKCRKNPDITYHGAVPNDEVRAALVKSHIFAYPSIWPETSCIAAMEAMSAKNVVVCPNYAALPETCGEWGWMYQWDENRNVHANRFAGVLAKACEALLNPETLRNANRMLDHQKIYYDLFYGWDARKPQWEAFLKNLLK